MTENTDTREPRLRELREPFPAEAVNQIPKGGVTLDYVGHAWVTDRLLAVDPLWSWEPVALTPEGTPLIKVHDGTAVMWIRLTVCGVTRLGVGTCSSNKAEVEKELIGDAIRNAAMRFGVALDLWKKEGPSDDAPRSQGSVSRPSSGGGGNRKASDKQQGFINKLLDERDTDSLETIPVVTELSMAEAKSWIDRLLNLPELEKPVRKKTLRNEQPDEPPDDPEYDPF